MIDGEHLVCPYCNKPVKYVDSIWIYGRSFGMVYCCFACDAYVGTHKKDGRPLGTLANKELRDARQKAHDLFDVVWKTGKMTRSAAYKWLASQMGKSADFTHIGMFDLHDCEQVVSICQDKDFRGLFR